MVGKRQAVPGKPPDVIQIHDIAPMTLAEQRLRECRCKIPQSGAYFRFVR